MRVLKKIIIGDDSDCATCQARHVRDMELLGEVKVIFLSNVTCPECGRETSVAVEAETEE